MRINTKVVGIRFTKGKKYLQELDNKGYELELKLQRDRDNQYDTNAIQVISTTNGDDKVLGFLPAEIAVVIASRIDEGHEVKILSHYYNKYEDEIQGVSLSIQI